MTLSKAIRKACDQLGFQTSIQTVQLKAQVFCGFVPDYTYTCSVRKNYEKELNNVVDDRTYEGQPERDMKPKTIKIKLNANPVNGVKLLEFMKESKWTEADVQNALAGIAKLRKLVA